MRRAIVHPPGLAERARGRLGAVDFPPPERTLVKAGLVLLRMATVGGKLVVEY